MNLTHKTYFTSKNKYLSNSKISDWLKDKNYFYKKHITGEIDKKVTDAMILGKAVDYALTNGDAKFHKAYSLVDRRSTKDNNYEYQLNSTMFEEVYKIVSNVREQDAFKELKKHVSQRILQLDMPLGIFKGLCGIPDWYFIDGDTCIITDLKTSNTVDPVKYHWHCVEFGYYKQFAMYTYLLRHKYPQIKDFIYRHLVVEKDPNGIYNVFTFYLSPDRVQMELNYIVYYVLPDIAKETTFAPKNVSWNDAITIGQIVEEF